MQALYAGMVGRGRGCKERGGAFKRKHCNKRIGYDTAGQEVNRQDQTEGKRIPCVEYFGSKTLFLVPTASMPCVQILRCLAP